MKKLLELFFDSKECEKIIIYTAADGVETTGELSVVKVIYESNINIELLYFDFFRYVNVLAKQLSLGFENNLIMHESIIKNIGFYENQYRQKRYRKNLTYKTGSNGGKYWIGSQYLLFSAYGNVNQNSWLYNDNDGNIVFELTPIYPWFYSDPGPGETFIKYSDWMKQYQPLLKRIIPKEVAQEWLVKLQELTAVVQKISKTLPCGGMLDCGGCIHLGKKND